MRLAIMQPYFFPYLGYFQLISSVEKFIFYDDVNFIKKGWINRNRALVQGKPHFFTVPVRNASQNKRIIDLEVSCDDLRWRKKLLETFYLNYSRAPFKEKGFELLENVLNTEEVSLSQLIKKSVISVCEYLKLETMFVDSSKVYNNDYLKGERRILDICIKEKANVYINAIGGRELYTKESFQNSDINLFFIKSNLPPYNQSSSDFVSGLSILDIIMNCDRDSIVNMMNQYDLLSAE